MICTVKRLLLVCLCLLLSSSICSAQESLDAVYAAYEKLFSQSSPTIVAVTQKGKPRDVHPSLGNGVGSGVIISKDGLVLSTISNRTRKHTHFHITHQNQKLYTAELINSDQYNGIILLQMKLDDGEELEFMKFGDSDKVKIGHIVMTIGNSFGSITQTNKSSYSAGVISGLYCPSGEGGFLGQLFETDAAVNPGSYGGALIDSQGKLIGLVTNTLSYNRWLGTAIPINQINRHLEDFKKTDSVFSPGSLNCKVIDKDDKITIVDVDHSSNKHNKELSAGMTIVALNGKTLDRSEDFLNAVSSIPSGSKALLNLLTEDGKPKQLTVTLNQQQVFQASSATTDQKLAHKASLGCVVSTELGKLGGARIKRALNPLGSAAKAGLKIGDVIYDLNGNSITCALALKKILNGLTVGTELTLKIYRDGKSQTVKVTLRSKLT